MNGIHGTEYDIPTASVLTLLSGTVCNREVQVGLSPRIGLRKGVYEVESYQHNSCGVISAV
jgi:hypothetical protein